MDIDKYQELTGITVAASQVAFINAQINRTKNILEDLLGYSLSPTTGSSIRIFPYHKHDNYLLIDPASSITTVRLIRGDEEIEVLELDDDYHIYEKNGYIKYLTRCYDDRWCICRDYCRSCAQLEVTGVWLWPEDGIPEDLLYVWADMVTYNGDCKNNIKSETLGTHSYTKFSREDPLTETNNQAIILKYAGGNGSIIRNITL